MGWDSMSDKLTPSERFQMCRWRKPAENGVPKHCGHRDVLPMAGVTRFNADSWCRDCAYFKAKRVDTEARGRAGARLPLVIGRR
jgi:hypothetical protein